VDLTLVDLVTGTEVPMGTAFDTFSEAAHTANAEVGCGLSGGAGQGDGIGRFVNYDQEWWHFSYPVRGRFRSIEPSAPEGRKSGQQ